MIGILKSVAENTKGDKRNTACIAILLGAPLSRQNFERVGIPFLSKEFNVIVFDFMPWLGRSSEGLHHETETWKDVFEVRSSEDLRSLLKVHRPDYALDFVGLCEITAEIQRALSGAGAKFVIQRSGNVPRPHLTRRIWHKLYLRLQKRQVTAESDEPVATAPEKGAPQTARAPRARALLRRLFQPILERCKLQAPDVALLAGTASVDAVSSRARKSIWVGSNDYHLMKTSPASSDALVGSNPYILFIDDNLPFASDWALLNVKPPVTPDVYYPVVRAFFERLEQVWRMPVVVAGHPSGQNDSRISAGFGERQIFFGRTASLVKGAAAVLVHATTAVSFTVLERKPILFLMTEELRLDSYALQVEVTAQQLGTKPIRIETLE
jgi:hypothetical protein